MRAKKYLRIISAFMTVLMVVMLVSACGGNSVGGGKKVVRIWTGDSGSKIVWEKMVENFNNTIGKEKNIKIEYTAYADGYRNILETALQSKQEAEIFSTTGNLDQYVKKSQVLPLNKLPGFENVEEEYKDYYVPNKTGYDGKMYKLPYGTITFGMVYNKDMFKKAGIVDENGEALPPETWDEWVECAKKLTNKDNNEYGVIFPMKWVGFWTYESIKPFTATKTLFNWETMEWEYEKFAPFMQALMKVKADKSFFPGPEGIENDAARAQFANGTIGMKFAASWDVGVYRDQFPASCDWDVAPFPVVEKGVKNKQDCQYLPSNSVSANISEDMYEPVSIVFKWLNSPEVLQTLYDNEIMMPYKADIINKTDNVSKQWKQFTDLLNVSKRMDEFPEHADGLETEYSIIDADEFSKIWGEQADIDSTLKKMSEVKNKELRDAYNKLGVDINEYKVENFNAKIKEEE